MAFMAEHAGSREVKEARQPHTCSRPCAFEEKKKDEKIHPTQITPRNPHQPSDPNHLETDREEMRPTRWPILAQFHRYRVCESRPRTALAISKTDEGHTYTDGQIKSWHSIRTPV